MLSELAWPEFIKSEQNFGKQMTCELGICGPGRWRPAEGGRKSGGEERGKLLVNVQRDSGKCNSRAIWQEDFGTARKIQKT